jgi:hypothetical protein
MYVGLPTVLTATYFLGLLMSYYGARKNSTSFGRLGLCIVILSLFVITGSKIWFGPWDGDYATEISTQLLRGN